MQLPECLGVCISLLWHPGLRLSAASLQVWPSNTRSNDSAAMRGSLCVYPLHRPYQIMLYLSQPCQPDQAVRAASIAEMC